MPSMKVRKKGRYVLSKAQNRLLKDSLKQLLGNGLISQPQRTEREERANFLKEALNSKILDSEWFS